MKHTRVFAGVAGAVVLLAPGARAQGAGAAAGSMQPARVQVNSKDSVRRMFIVTPLIDSLVKRLNGLPFGSAEFIATQNALDAAIREIPRPAGGTFTVQIQSGGSMVARRLPLDVVPLGTLGFTADGVNRSWYGPAGNYLQYFEYPTVVAIEANSPASRAGVRAGDLVVAYDGLDVKENVVNMTHLLTPGRDVTVKLRREGDMHDVVMSVDKAPAALIAERRAGAMGMVERRADAMGMVERRAVEAQAVGASRVATGQSLPRTPVAAGPTGGVFREVPSGSIIFSPSASGVLGAAMTDVDPELATAIRGMEGKRGVLVTRVVDGSIADRTGLRGGDVILRVESMDVLSVAHFRVRMAQADQSGQEKVKITVLRAGKTQEITYLPRER